MADVHLNPYGNPSDFVVDGRVRGHHLLSMPDTSGRQGYEAHVVIAGALPVCALARGTVAPVFGPRQPTADGVAADFDVYSTAFGFPHDVFDDPAVRTALGGARGSVHRVFVVPRGESTHVSIYAFDGDDAVSLYASAAFAIALTRRLDVLAREDRRYRDAREALRELDLTGEPSEDRLRELRAVVDDLVTFAQGTTERVGQTIESRFTVSHAGVEHAGSLVVHVLDPLIRSVELVFQGALPPVAVAILELTSPEPGGLMGFVRKWGELVVDDAALDRAFLVVGDGRAKPIVLAARAELLSLARHPTKVSWQHNALVVSVSNVPSLDYELSRLLAALFELWRRAALHRLGERDGVVDD